ncbi:MAG: type II toxin-antitoxin system VapC family toxin [Thermomicrobiales bacterium]
MSFLLDTNTVSEAVKPRPDPNVAAWINQLDEALTFVSVATLAEVRHGIELMVAGRRRRQLTTWLDEELPDRFGGRILEIDRRVADSWGVVMARAQRLGASISVMDCFFAATAEVHGLTLATRNVRHFAPLGIPIFNPWTYELPTE